MPDRWPESMPFSQACEYLGVGATKGKAILNRLPSFQHDLGDPSKTNRGDRYWARQVLDEYIYEDRMRTAVHSPKEDAA